VKVRLGEPADLPTAAGWWIGADGEPVRFHEAAVAWWKNGGEPAEKSRRCWAADGPWRRLIITRGGLRAKPSAK